MTHDFKIGMVGLDTSHVPAFAKILNDPSHEHHVPGGRVVIGYPGGSADFAHSYSRVEGFTNELRDRFGVRIAESVEEVVDNSDVLLLESVDGRVHPEQFERLAPYRKPVFIDKPFAVNAADAVKMKSLAETYDIPVMSCSSLRYAAALTRALENESDGAVIGADFYGPMHLQPTQPGLFWYGIHTVDMLFATLGRGCVKVTAATNDDYDVIVGEWQDGRLGSIRGNRTGNLTFGGTIHRERGSSYVGHDPHAKPNYACLLEKVMKMFVTRIPPIDLAETVEIVRFIEAANESRASGKSVRL